MFNSTYIHRANWINTLAQATYWRADYQWRLTNDRRINPFKWPVYIQRHEVEVPRPIPAGANLPQRFRPDWWERQQYILANDLEATVHVCLMSGLERYVDTP